MSRSTARHALAKDVFFVILGAAMTAFWFNVLWSMGAHLYWERDSGNLELYIMSPAPMMSTRSWNDGRDQMVVDDGVGAGEARIRLQKRDMARAKLRDAVAAQQGLRRLAILGFLTTFAFVAFEATFSLFGKARFDLAEGSTALVFLGIGMLIFLAAIISSWRGGALAPSNPWASKGLEWQTETPVPLENFPVLPVVTSDPYGYGVPDPYDEIKPKDPETVKVGAR